MELKIAILGTLMACLASPLLCQNDTSAQEPVERDLRFDNTEIATALGTLEQEFGVEIVHGKGISGTVTASLQAVDVDRAMAAICGASGLAWRKITFWGSPPQLEAEVLGAMVEAAEKLKPNAFSIEGHGEQAAVGFYRMRLADLPLPAGQQEKKTVYYVFSRRPKTTVSQQDERQGKSPPPLGPIRTGERLFSDFERQFRRMSLEDRVKVYKLMVKLVQDDRELMGTLHGPPPDFDFPEPPPPPDELVR